MEGEEQLPDWSKLPPEVWCLIIDENLKDPKDLSNLLLASPLIWDNILHSKKAEFLLPFVLPLVAGVRSYLDHASILKCRLVCSSWKLHVDNYLKNHPCLVNLDGINHEKKDCIMPTHIDSSYCWERAAICVQTSAQIQSIIEKMNAYPGGNPFLVQCLEFRDFIWDPAMTWEIAPEVWRDLETLLNKVGSSILHFRFLSNAQRTGPVFYQYIRRLLHLLPNLRTLRFWFVAGPGDIRVPQCEQLIQSNSLPNLEHLKVLKSVHVPTVIMNALLKKYSSQLEKLEILSLRPHSHLYSYDEDAINCSNNFNELSIRLWSLNDIWKLNSSGLLSSSLKSLNVFMDLSCDSDSLEKLFYVLSTCKAADFLERFSLEILVDTFGPLKRMVDPQTRLKLSQLKKLKINCKLRCLNTVDFILDMDSLEEFVVIMENIRIMDQPGTSGGFSPELLKFIGYEECLYESNVWELLPKLKRIQITDEVLEEEDNGNSFFDRDTSTHKRHFLYNRQKWEEIQIKPSSSK